MRSLCNLLFLPKSLYLLGCHLQNLLQLYNIFFFKRSEQSCSHEQHGCTNPQYSVQLCLIPLLMHSKMFLPFYFCKQSCRFQSLIYHNLQLSLLNILQHLTNDDAIHFFFFIPNYILRDTSLHWIALRLQFPAGSMLFVIFLFMRAPP